MIPESARATLVLIAILLSVLIAAGWVWLGFHSRLFLVLFKPILAIILLLLLLACPVGIIMAARKCALYGNLITIWTLLFLLYGAIPAVNMFNFASTEITWRWKEKRNDKLDALLSDTTTMWKQIKPYVTFLDGRNNTFIRILEKRRTDIAGQMIEVENFNPEQEIGFATILVRLYPDDYTPDKGATKDVDHVADFLLRQGCDINATTVRKEYTKNISALCLAARAADTATCHLLMDKGIDLSIHTSCNETALYYAAGHRENAAIVRRILETDTTGLNLPTANGETPLIRAANERNNIEIIRLLLDYGAEVNAKDEDGYTALNSTDPTQLDIISLLLERGADPDIKPVFGFTILFKAIAYPEATKMLLDHGADPFQTNSDGQTLLMLAAREECPWDVSVYLKLGLDVNARDKHGQSALYYAVRSGSLECVELLLANGADITNVTIYGETLLFPAAYTNDIRILKLLLDKGLDVKQRDEAGEDALYLAVKNGCAENAKLLIEHRAPTDRTYGEEGKTLEVIAAYYPDDSDIRQLIKKVFQTKAAAQ